MKRLNNAQRLLIAFGVLLIAGLWPVSRVEIGYANDLFVLPGIYFVESSQAGALGLVAQDPECQISVRVERHRWRRQADRSYQKSSEPAVAAERKKLGLPYRTSILHENLILTIILEGGEEENHGSYREMVVAGLTSNLADGRGLTNRIDTAGNRAWELLIKPAIERIPKPFP